MVWGVGRGAWIKWAMDLFVFDFFDFLIGLVRSKYDSIDAYVYYMRLALYTYIYIQCHSESV